MSTNIVPGTVNLDPYGVNAYGSLGSPPDAQCPSLKVIGYVHPYLLERPSLGLDVSTIRLGDAQIPVYVVEQTSNSVSAPKWSPTPPTKDGRVLVPKVPTPEMDAAGKQALRDNGVGDLDESDAILCYSAMLAAAPQPAS